MKGLLKVVAVGVGVLFSMAVAAECEVTIDSNDQMRFDTDHISIPASCKSFKVTLTHSGSLPANTMGHNWVLTESNNVQAVAMDGMSAGLDNDYVKPDDERVLAYTKVIGGGDSTSVSFDVSELDADTEYSFLCSFPGHYALMKGTVSID